MIIVTAGARYIDIDAYACSVAYAELLNLCDKPAIAISTAPLNESITAPLRALQVPFSNNYQPKPDDKFVIVDLSDPVQLDPLVDESRVIEVFDHHPKFEEYWSGKLGGGSHIEPIGAAATLIYEQWVNASRELVMSHESATLLAAAILDNTLNFGAHITSDRDKTAYLHLLDIANLDDSFASNYFSECQQAITENLATSLRNDTKFLTFNNFGREMCVGQLVVWDVHEIITDDLKLIAETLSGMGSTWMANIVSISEQRSYFVADDTNVQHWLEQSLKLQFNGQLAVADRAWLRKEILQTTR